MASVLQRLDVLMLAAGQSRRMGAENKLLMPFRSTTLIRHVTEQLIAANLGEVLVVTGFDAERVTNELLDLPVRFCHNSDYEMGQMSSVRAGCRVLTGPREGMMVALSDMPFLSAEDYCRLHRRFRAQSAPKILIPDYAGERGNPIIIPREFIADIAKGTMKAGCRKLVRDHPEKTEIFAVDSSAYIADIDTPGDYEHLLNTALAARAPCC
ncbi:nucleotidyltransferase family protein [Sneathiella marina]|uniref:Nucleotidyltransferase family protein n=1 Tax=Sneathiella marina TaxID=2950108 RepID=A0ABY4W731_9PROT|nr:nucleotidyltransferase family protein [Sneathiella marina]USG62827.1 nucleotidyltransferase family protein [Sneathiella marina]